MDEFFREAVRQAREGLAEGGIPIGAVLVLDGRVVGAGHNQRVQRDSPILHAEMACLEAAGRLRGEDYARSTLYTTLSPCDMCSGAILLYGIRTVIVGEHETLRGPEDYLRERGVDLTVLDDPDCISLMSTFIRERPDLWREDIGA